MRRADRHRQGIDAGLGDEYARLLRVGEQLGVVVRLHVIGGGDPAQLGLHRHAAPVGVGHDLPGDGDVLLQGPVGGVDHDRGEPGGDGFLDDREVAGVVKMQGDGDGDLLLRHLGEELAGEAARRNLRAGQLPLRDLDDERRGQRLPGLEHRPDHGRVTRRKRADGVAAALGCGQEGTQAVNAAVAGWHMLLLALIGSPRADAGGHRLYRHDSRSGRPPPARRPAKKLLAWRIFGVRYRQVVQAGRSKCPISESGSFLPGGRLPAAQP